MTESQPQLASPNAPGAISGFTPARFAALLGCVVVVVFAEVLLGARSFVFRDFGHFGYPLAVYHREAFWRGELPLWNPLSQCGLPFLAQWNTLALYPGSLIYLLLPLPWSLNLFNVLHLFWAGLGMYCLAQAWTRHRFAAACAGFAYAFSGLLQDALMWPNNIAALGWMPWVILMVPQGWQRGGRRLTGAVIVGAMQMLTGAPEVILLTWGVVGVMWVLDVVRQRDAAFRLGKRLLLGVIVVALLAAVQLLPFLELLGESQRDTHFYESVWPMPVLGWANLLVPLFQCHSTVQGAFFQPDQYWTSSYYVGIATLALALLAVMKRPDGQIRTLATLAVLGLLLAMGNSGGVYGALKYVLPPLGLIRFPIKFVVLTVFALPLLAASGASLLLPADATNERSRGRSWWRVAGILTAIIALLLLFTQHYPAAEEQAEATVKNGLARVGFLWATLGLFLLTGKTAGRVRVLAGVATLLVLAADAFSHAPFLSPTVATETLQRLPRTDFLVQRPSLGQDRAMVSYWAHHRLNRSFRPTFEGDFQVKRAGEFANCNLLDGVPKADGFYSLSLRDADAIHGLLYFRTNDARLTRVFQPTNRIGFDGLLDFLAVSRISAPGQPSQSVSRTNCLPWVTAGQRPIFTSPAETLQRLVAPDFDPRREVLLPSESRESCASAQAGGVRVLTTQFSAHRVHLALQAAAPGLVVIGQSHFRPWRARVDGVPAEIHPANLAFQAVLVPAGSRVLELTYEDARFRAGLLVSVVTLLVLVGGSLLWTGPPVMKGHAP
jgi:hypothetical protein